MSAAKLEAGILALAGLIEGVLIAIISTLGGSLIDKSLGVFGGVVGIGSIITLPITFGIVGFIMGAIAAFIYNLVAGKLGGLELEFEQATATPA